MDNNEINSIILKIYEEQKKTNKKIDNMEKQIDGLQEQVNEIPGIKEELRALSGRVAVIEKGHGEKLQILLDVVTGNSEKNKELEKRIEKDEKIINKHSDEIYYLEQKVQNG